MANKKWDWSFNLDAAVGETVERTFVLDGREYTAVVTPKARVDAVRKPPPKSIGLGESPVEKTSMSLGPRPGGCPMCGR